MRFDWQKKSVADWQKYYQQASRANYLQSMPFARAVRMCDQKTTRLGLIKLEDQEVGMVAIQEIKLGPIHFVYLYRGPLWFQDNPPKEYLDQFASLFAKTFPRRILRRRRWLPEWKNSEEARTTLAKHGFKSKSQTYETIWLDLERSLPSIRAGLKQKWRNALNKGERAKLDIQVDWSGATTKLFLSFYERDRLEKKYRGRTVKFIAEEITTAKVFKEVLILWAIKDKKPAAGILVLLHGHSASYRVGWTTPAGRNCNAHNVLLWEAIKILKDVDIHQFDLGGVEPQTADGLTRFKAGLGGDVFRTPGIYA
jgi:lipid II:glycine glycyltransferase (peptidoglycan interpeptide bridge formation enzyme)